MKGPIEQQLDEELNNKEAVEQAIAALDAAIVEFWEEEAHGNSARYEESAEETWAREEGRT
ncbi:MAG: hypothetical protein V4510_13085 [bacterium]